MGLFDNSNTRGSSGIFTDTAPVKRRRTSAPKPSALSVAQNQAQNQAKAAEGLPPLLGLGQGILKSLLTSGAAGVAATETIWNNIAKGELNNPIEAAGKNVAALWKADNLFSAGGWDDVRLGEDVYRETVAPSLGLNPDEKFVVPTQAAALAYPMALPLILGLSKENEETGQRELNLGASSAWAGFGIDVATDPLTFFAKGASQAIGGAVRGAAAVSKASALAKRGEVAAGLTAGRAKDNAAKVNWSNYGGSLGQKKLPAKLESVKTNIVKADPKATKKIEKKQAALVNNQYKTTRIESPRTFTEAINDIVLSGLVAGKKSVATSYITARQSNFLEKYAKRDVTGIFEKTIKTKIAKDTDSGNYAVLSGNGVKLGEAASKPEAKKLAEDLQMGIERAESLTPVGMIQGAVKTEAKDDVGETVTMPAKDGTEVQLEQWVPHKGDNGKFYVYDGDNVFELATSQDADELIAVFTSEAGPRAEPVISKAGRQWQVNVGSKVSRFGTKKEAQAYSDAVRTGEISSRRAVTTGGTPIVDSVPASVSVEDALKVPSKKEVSALRKVLQGIDDVAKKTSGWRSEVAGDAVDAAKRILDDTQGGAVDKFLLNASEEALRQPKAFLSDEIPFDVMVEGLRGGDKSKNDLLNVILKKTPVKANRGTISLENALKIAKGEFLNLTKAIDGVDGIGLESQVRDYISVNVVQRAERLKSGEIKPVGTEEGVFQALVSAVGKKNAESIRKTGYITDKTQANRKKLDQVFDNMKVANEEVSYAGYDDLVEGLRRGDEVSESSLQELFRILDPKGGLIAKFEQKGAESNADFLRFVFTEGGGVRSIEEAERRLAMALDPEMLMKHANLAYEAEVLSLIKIFEEQGPGALAKLELASSREAAATSFANRGPEIRRDAVDSLNTMFMGYGPHKGVIESIRETIGEPGGIRKVSSLNDEIVTNVAEAYTGGSRSVMSKQLQQSAEQKLISSLLGKFSDRARKAGPSGATPKERLDKLIKSLEAANDYMNGVGFRFVRTKNRDDSTFQNAYLKAIQEAKDTNTTPNFSALSKKHTVYLPMANILSILKASGAEDALVRGFIPPKNRAKGSDNVLDWISLGDASRRVLEMDSAGEVFDLEEIVQRLIKKPSESKMSKQRAQKFKEVANEIAEKLTDPDVVAQLRGVHLDNAAAIVKDSAEKVTVFREDLFNALDEAWAVMHMDNKMSEAARMEIVRRHFRRFAIGADLLRLQDGPVAETMFRATASLFGEGGKVPPVGKTFKDLSAKEQEVFNLMRDGELRLFREALTKYYRFSDIPTVPPGREGIKLPSKAVRDKAGQRLEQAMIAYRTHMDELSTVEAMDDLTAIREWEKTQKKIKKELDSARTDAWYKGVQTYHYKNGDWVESELFDHAEAIKEAEQIHNKYIAGRQGLEDRAAYLADSVPEVPSHKKLTASQKAKFLEKYRKDATEYQINKSESILDDAAKNVADEVSAGRLDGLDMTPSEKMMLAAQNVYARALKEGSEIVIAVQRAAYGSLPKSPVEFNRSFRPLIDENTPVLLRDRMGARWSQFAERWSGYGGRADAGAILKQAENESLTESTNFAGALDKLQRQFSNSSAKEFDEAWDAVRSGELADNASELAKALDSFVNVTFRGHAQSVLTKDSIDGQALSEAFSRFGIFPKVDKKAGGIAGMPSIKTLEGMTPEELAQNLFDELPFGTMPSKYRGTDAGIAWDKRAKAFKKDGNVPLLVFTRMMEAIQLVKQEKSIATQFISQFGWKNHFRTIDEAIADGWVQVAASGPQNIARFLPDAQGGNLFHPQIAEQMGSVFREYNNNFAEAKFAGFLRGLMKVMGVVKFTQTTLMPRHHVTNSFGDITTAFIAGAFRNPRQIVDGFRIAKSFTARNLQAEWGDNFTAQGDRLAAAVRDQPGAQPPRPEGSDLTFVVSKNGKPTQSSMSLDELSIEMGKRGHMVPGFVVNDIQGFTNDMFLKGSTPGVKDSFGTMWNELSRAGRGTMKAFSDFTASYSNAIRATHAVHVMQSRTWNSFEEMMNAVTKKINLYHPTVQSLGSTERRWGRLVFTYYTWLRVAHSAMIDMAINHAGSMLAVPKGMYAYSLSQGFKPESAAVPFEDNSQLPDYIAYSVYGPNAMGPQGPRTMRPPFLPLDVLDFWKIYYDPSKSGPDNAIAMAGQTAQLAGGAFNIFGKPIIAASQSRSGQAPNAEEFVDATLSNFGFMSLLTGLDLYTPYRYRDPDTTNPLTDADRQRLLENSFSGMRAVDIYRPINDKLGKSQYGSRVKNYNEQMQKENIKRVQSFVDDRISEGYTREQIIELLNQLGVK